MRKLSLLLLFSIALCYAIGQPGSLDSSFGNNGIQTTAFYNNPRTSFWSICIQGNKIIAAGYAYNPVAQSSDFALARYTANGTLDSSFGVNGKVTTVFDSLDDQANAIVLQGDKIIVAGTTTGIFISDFALARYTADGKLDPSFGVNGKVRTDFDSSYDHGANAIAIQGN